MNNLDNETPPTREQQNEETGHTPGPWTLQDGYTRRDKGWIRCQKHALTETGRPAGIGMAVARVSQDIGFYEEFEANARLIAAAPELLEALKELAQWEGPSYAVSRALRRFQDSARAVIAKAEGRAA